MLRSADVFLRNNEGILFFASVQFLFGLVFGLLLFAFGKVPFVGMDIDVMDKYCIVWEQLSVCCSNLVASLDLESDEVSTK